MEGVQRRTEVARMTCEGKGMKRKSLKKLEESTNSEASL